MQWFEGEIIMSTQRHSVSRAGILATLVAAITGCGPQVRDTTALKNEASANVFGGLKSRSAPSYFALGTNLSHQAQNGFARADIVGYAGPFLGEGKATAETGNYFNAEPGRSKQAGADAVASVLFDGFRAFGSEPVPAGHTFASSVLAIGASAGFSYAKSDGFVSDQSVASVGGRALVMAGPFQADIDVRTTAHSTLKAKQDYYSFNGDARGMLANLALSFDAGPVLPGNAHLVLVPWFSLTQLDRSLEGNVQGQNVKLTSDSRSFNGGAAAIADFGNEYLGLAAGAGQTNIPTGNSLGPTSDDSNHSWDARLLGGIKLGEIEGFSVYTDFQGFYGENGPVTDYGGSLQLRINK